MTADGRIIRRQEGDDTRMRSTGEATVAVSAAAMAVMTAMLTATLAGAPVVGRTAREAQAPGRETQAQPAVGEYDARAVAVADSRVDERDVRDMSVSLGRDGGILCYDVTFDAGGMSYDYEVDAQTGAIRALDVSGTRR